MSAVANYDTDLTDEQWDLLASLWPKPTWQPGGPGRPPIDLRQAVNGITHAFDRLPWRLRNAR